MYYSDRKIPSLTAHDWQRTNCYGCGSENPHSLKANFAFDERTGEVRFRHTPTGFEHGAPGYMHGGAMATIMDEAQGALCHHIGHLIMTDQLHMKYHKAIPIHQSFDVRCWVTTVRKRRMYTRGTFHSPDGELLVSSSATWYLLSERITQRLFKDQMPEEEREFIRRQLEANRKRARDIRRRLREEKKKQNQSG